MKIRDYLGIGAEKEAELKAKATFSLKRSIHEPDQKGIFSPFEKAMIESIFPGAKTISKGGIPYPNAARVYLSYACSHNCPDCLYGADSKGENVFMNSNTFSKLIDSLHSLKVKFVDLSGGGEPTLHAEFHKFAKMCIQQKFNLSLLSNAASFTLDIVNLLVEGFSFLRVNLDASNDEVYNRIHHPPNPGEFQKVLGNLERIVSERERKKSDLIVGARVWLCQANMNFMEEITCLVKDVGLDYIQFRINHKVFGGLLSEQREEVDTLIKELKNSYHPFEVYGEVETGKFCRGCWLSPIYLVINPWGDVYPCYHFDHRPENTSFGNIFTQPADRLWFGTEHRRIVEHLRENDCYIKDCRWRFYNEFLWQMIEKDRKP
ncbi:MAG: radical SAM protein [candidate division Zixibacteria bacterium]|nr:radical SAM protein [candidate division Zixibacteria bacterium]